MQKISVVTITYNAETTLPKTLESVLAQTYRNVEHLIVDGASKDNTLALTHDYARLSADRDCGHEVIIVSEPDKGIYDAMNKGLRLATGQYIVFMNAGDRFHASDTLEHVAQWYTDSDKAPAVVYGDTNIVDAEGQFLYRRRLTPPETLSWKSFRTGMRVCHQAFYARADLAQQTPYDLHYRFSADVDWCIRIMKKAAGKHLPMVNMHEVVADYLEEGATTRNHRASLRERFHVMSRHYGLPTTLAMHAWFVVRNIINKLKT